MILTNSESFNEGDVITLDIGYICIPFFCPTDSSLGGYFSDQLRDFDITEFHTNILNDGCVLKVTAKQGSAPNGFTVSGLQQIVMNTLTNYSENQFRLMNLKINSIQSGNAVLSTGGGSTGLGLGTDAGKNPNTSLADIFKQLKSYVVIILVIVVIVAAVYMVRKFKK